MSKGIRESGPDDRTVHDDVATACAVQLCSAIAPFYERSGTSAELQKNKKVKSYNKLRRALLSRLPQRPTPSWQCGGSTWGRRSKNGFFKTRLRKNTASPHTRRRVPREHEIKFPHARRLVAPPAADPIPEAKRMPWECSSSMIDIAVACTTRSCLYAPLASAAR